MNTLIKNLQKLSKSMEQKRKVGKVNIFGAILFFVAAFFAVSLALAFIGEGEGNFLSGPGSFLANAYGYSSILIPVFFLTAALQMIGAKWNIKKGVILVGSILPFFTLVAVEHICKIFAAKNSGAVAMIEITSTIVFGIILIVGEYILLVILGEIFHERYSKGGFDFDNFDESDFDKPLGTGKDDEAASNNGDKFEAKPSADSPILDEMLEKATEIPRTQGETVLEFIKKQKPVDLEAIFKNAERKARAERDEREARQAEERSRMAEEATPAESAEVEAEAASGTEQEPPAADQPAETPKSKETADVINNIMSRIQAAEAGETTEDSYGEPEAETELEDEEGGKNDEIDLNDDFWSSSADLEPFDKEAAIEMQKRENENKFSKIFDAVENDSEVKLTDWRYEEALKNILPEMLHEQQPASPLPRQAPAPADFKSQIETLLAKKHEESTPSPASDANANYATENAIASDESADYTNENAEIANANANYTSENAETASDESANYANKNAEIASDESANFANESAEIVNDENANYTNENAEIANDETAYYANENAEIAGDESADYANENAEIANENANADYANENAEIAGDESEDYANENADIANDESAYFANENAETASGESANFATESASDANANFANENAEIANDESANYASENAEIANANESANFASENYANESAEIAGDESANYANESAEIANDESAAQIPVSTSDLKIEDIISSMDDDAAENPVLKEPIQEVVAKIMEKKKAEQSVEQPRPEPVLSEFESRAEKIEREPREIEEMAAAEEALKAASNETYEPMQNAESREFDPTARPVVDANGNLIHYPEEDEDEVQEDDEQLRNEIIGYQTALKAEDEDEEDEESNDDYDDDFEEEIDDLNRTMNRTMNASEALDEESEDDEEEDIEDEEEGTAAPAHSIDPYAASANSMPESQKFRKGPYIVPTDLLDSYPGNEYWIVDDETRQSGNDLVETLKEFKIDTEITGIRKGPTVTMYELLPAPGVKLSKIVALQDNIALRLAASSVRIVAPIPGKHAVGIEVPNRNRAIVSFRELIEQPLPAFDKMAIPVVLGKDISGEPQLLDLAKTPHLLIAGSTGAGKSVCVNSMLLSILYKRSPEQVKLVLVDPKVVELKLYNDIPHLLTPVITDAKRALQSLQYCLCEMERRYALLDGMGVRNIISYNKKIVEKHIATEKLPYIVVVIDEFADLMATTGKELETTIARLAAMSRAVGIHLVLATQRPSVDVITGLIKANIPSRIAFMVASKTDSRIIIDQLGADKLLGKGDMLYVGVTDPFPSRIQGTLVGDDEVERVVEYVKGFGEPEYIDEEMFVDEDEEEEDTTVFDDGEDPLYDQALQIVLQAGKASASYIQRRLKIGYNRAARLVEEMEERGIVGPQNGSKPREVIHLP